MNFEMLFKGLSYAAVFCGFFALWISGAFSILGAGLFLAAFIGGWFLEGTRFQVSERLGTALIVASIPVYFLLYRSGFFEFTSSETMLAGVLARLILTLTAIKILQNKSDRDWIFLYLMAFFEVLLAAGLSISAMYFGSFIAYVFVMACTIILFEIRKTDRSVRGKIGKASLDELPYGGLRARRIPATAAVLLIFITLAAAPLFFLLPRVGGAGIGGNNAGGVSASSGFSDRVKLGGIGRIQQNDEVVMRARIENHERYTGDIRWRGLALDTFTGDEWSKSSPGAREPRPKGDHDLIQVDFASGRESLVLQTIYLEPLDTPILFVLPRAVGIQANFPLIYKDRYSSLQYPGKGERISYKVLSDTAVPPENDLRADRAPYPSEFENYLQLPAELDLRVAALAESVTADARNRYDAARAVEKYLQTEFGYTLEQKAGGDDPLGDFLFNVREGHCEYFATSMAIMLRTQGIATRVVNGFQRGDYNETADVFVIRQRNAHSWVEVYFPGEESWITFDPTPFAGQNLTGSQFGVTARLNKYLEAIETFWIQYFVAFDNQEQRSLFASIRRGLVEYRAQTSRWTDRLQVQFAEWWREARGDRGLQQSLNAISWAAAYAAIGLALVLGVVWGTRKVVKSKVWQLLWERFFARRHASVIEFYDRMQAVLASKGFTREPHQTPLEFAYSVGMPQAVLVTQQYNRVRFGERYLTSNETEEIQRWLDDLEAVDRSNNPGSAG